MQNKKYKLSRRAFLKTAGLAGVGAIITPFNQSVQASEEAQAMPTRPFGKSGINVPILSFGGSLNTSMSPLLLRQAAKWGVTYWDTAHSYMGGNSEKGIGKYFAKFPEDRKKIFLVTKSHAWTLGELTKDLNNSLERMKTDYIDLFFVHSVSDISDIDDDTRLWAEKSKSGGKIRLFGFSTHSNMAACLLGASRLGWIDGIMMTYNYRLMHTDRMKRAVDACANAGIGLTAMKTQGGGQVKTNTEAEFEIAGRFIKKGYTEAQAKLKAVWENPNISSICSEMPNMTILMSNVAAAINKTELSSRDMNLLHQYAQETYSDYCTGCTEICESTIKGQVPIGDVMRYLMYCRSYGDCYRAKLLFKDIPKNARAKMASLDYSLAEKRCPQNMAIGNLMREALRELS
ncbi:MAG: aldo/keto reductase [Desulfobacterales bacterium]|nr:MAG: aldo/keto reductase [Desulfobacterales bacterium]